MAVSHRHHGDQNGALTIVRPVGPGQEVFARRIGKAALCPQWAQIGALSLTAFACSPVDSMARAAWLAIGSGDRRRVNQSDYQRFTLGQSRGCAGIHPRIPSRRD